jgi:hypothetical protein
MISMAPTIRVIARSSHEDRPHGAALIVASAAIDAIAAGILLVHAPVPLWLACLAAVISHATAVLLLTDLGRPWLPPLS